MIKIASRFSARISVAVLLWVLLGEVGAQVNPIFIKTREECERVRAAYESERAVLSEKWQQIYQDRITLTKACDATFEPGYLLWSQCMRRGEGVLDNKYKPMRDRISELARLMGDLKCYRYNSGSGGSSYTGGGGAIPSNSNSQGGQPTHTYESQMRTSEAERRREEQIRSQNESWRQREAQRRVQAEADRQREVHKRLQENERRRKVEEYRRGPGAQAVESLTQSIRDAAGSDTEFRVGNEQAMKVDHQKGMATLGKEFSANMSGSARSILDDLNTQMSGKKGAGVVVASGTHSHGASDRVMDLPTKSEASGARARQCDAYADRLYLSLFQDAQRRVQKLDLLVRGIPRLSSKDAIDEAHYQVCVDAKLLKRELNNPKFYWAECKESEVKSVDALTERMNAYIASSCPKVGHSLN